MEPTKKAPEIEQLLEEQYGRTTAITSNKCIPPPIGCGKMVGAFRNPISEKEYRISGLCQDCQDEIFGAD